MSRYTNQDIEWAMEVFARDDHRCQIAGCDNHALDACHILSRRVTALRHDPDNGITLCREHHEHCTAP